MSGLRIGSVMHQIQDFSDKRNKTWCVHCRKFLSDVAESRDHVPSKALLAKPYPEELPTVPVCKKCNEEFARDEEYLAAFLGCVLSGSADPEAQIDPATAEILSRSPSLRTRIEYSMIEFKTRGGETRRSWVPEQDRIERIALKNARGHAFFEYGEPMLNEPSYIWCSPIFAMTDDQRRDFFRVDRRGGYPEVGSRMLTRVMTGEDLVDGWIEVQEGMYRYLLVQQGVLVVRSVIREYLISEVGWSD